MFLFRFHGTNAHFCFNPNSLRASPKRWGQESLVFQACIVPKATLAKASGITRKLRCDSGGWDHPHPLPHSFPTPLTQPRHHSWWATAPTMCRLLYWSSISAYNPPYLSSHGIEPVWNECWIDGLRAATPLEWYFGLTLQLNQPSLVPFYSAYPDRLLRRVQHAICWAHLD